MNKREFLEDLIFKDPCNPERKETSKWDIYAKNHYRPEIKITNWWYHRESYPKDNDCVKNYAAYKRWGTWNEDKSRWITETTEAMEEGRGDAELNALKDREQPLRLLGFLSYPVTLKTRKDLVPEEIRKILPSLPKDQLTLRYTTTNQSHYKKIHILPK